MLEVYAKRIAVKFVKVGGVEVKLSELMEILSDLNETDYGMVHITIPDAIATVLSSHGMVMKSLRGSYAKASRYETMVREWFPEEADAILVKESY